MKNKQNRKQTHKKLSYLICFAQKTCTALTSNISLLEKRTVGRTSCCQDREEAAVFTSARGFQNRLIINIHDWYQASFFSDCNEHSVGGLRYLFCDLAVARTFLEFTNTPTSNIW